MGEYSDYFEDFPEENPENYVNGRFDPVGAKALQQQYRKAAEEQANLNREIAEIVRKARMSKTAK